MRWWYNAMTRLSLVDAAERIRPLTLLSLVTGIPVNLIKPSAPVERLLLRSPVTLMDMRLRSKAATSCWPGPRLAANGRLILPRRAILPARCQAMPRIAAWTSLRGNRVRVAVLIDNTALQVVSDYQLRGGISFHF